MIVETVVRAVAVGAGACALRIKLEAARDRARRWQEAARECGVTDVRVSTALGLPVAVDGRKGTLGVRITSYGDMSRQSGAEEARALGRCGTPAHVPLLRDAERVMGGSGPLAGTCRAAVAAIQARQAPASPGQRSLSANGGEVSLADDARGRITVEREP